MMVAFRKTPPPIRQVNAVTDISVEKTVMENGISLYTINAGTEDVMRIEFIFHAGSVKGSPLLAETVNQMLAEGTMRFKAEELNNILDFYGIFINLSSEKDYAGLTMFFLTKHIDKALEMAAEILYYPVFPADELGLMMKKRLSWHRITREKVQNLANDQFFESVFGDHHPYGIQVRETDFDNIDPLILKNFHQGHYYPGNMTAIISGKIHADTFALFEKYFGDIENSKNLYTENNIELKGSPLKKVRIDKAGAVQTAIRIGSATITRRHPDYPGLKILNTILGGYFGSRLMKNIREEKGYTYGIHSNVSSFDQSGVSIITTEVGSQYTKRALKEIYRELRILREVPVTEDELGVVRNYLLGEMVRMFDGPFATAETFKSVWEFGMDFGYYQKMMNTVKTITPDELMRLATLYYKTDDLYEITAG